MNPQIEPAESGKLYEFQGKTPHVHSSCFLAAGSRVIGDVILEENVSIWFNVVVRGDVERIRIGKNSNVQDNVVIHVTHFKNPTMIGENVTVGHGAILHGCTVQDGALIGMNAVVLDRAVVGKGALVAAGAVVTPNTHIPDGMLAAGVPAKVMRHLSDAEKQMVTEGAPNYMMYTQHYRNELPPKKWDTGEFAG
ncbi:MAG: gamma carbonic anhydrase family protein [Bacteroidota bacterium]|nr:gamma carbonic anhydrase family protein [Bacteroidota bacterium]